MRPFDPKIDREVPVILVDDHLHIQLDLGDAFASLTSGVTRGVIVVNDLPQFMLNHGIEDSHNLCSDLADAIGAHSMINGFKSHFTRPRDFKEWRPGMITANDFVIRLDGRTSKLGDHGGWIHPADKLREESMGMADWSSPKSNPLEDIIALADKMHVDAFTRHRHDTMEVSAHEYGSPPVKLPMKDRLPLANSAEPDPWNPPIDPRSRPNVNIPEGALVALMMMLGEKKIIIREEDLWAAERWREQGGLKMFVQRDPYSIIVKLEE